MKIKKTILALMLILLVVAFCGCGDKDYETEKVNSEKVQITTKNTPEQIILAHLAAIIIEEKTVHEEEIEEKENISSKSLYNDLKDGNIDLYFDYTGSIYLNALGLPKEDMQNAVLLTQLQKLLIEKDVYLSESVGYDGGMTLYMTPEVRESLKDPIYISDLKTLAPKLKIGMEESFFQRKSGYKALEKTYELQFGKAKVYTEDEGFLALRRGDIDIMVGSRTSVYNNMYNLYLFRDDKRFFINEDACFVAKDSYLLEYPEIKNALGTFDNLITSGTMSILIRKTYVEGNDMDTYLRDFLRARNLM
ncbi:MAG: glycine betaine ABC transporter substrate-binding protein [Clostridiales bacterium]